MKMRTRYFDGLVRVLLRLKTRLAVEDFLRGILTPQELEQLALRLQIVKRLKKGETQRDIADDLGVGIATVTRGSRELKLGRFAYV